MCCLQLWKYNRFWFPPGSDEIISLFFLFTNAFHAGYAKNPKINLPAIFDVYQHIRVLNKGLSVVHKLHVWYDLSLFILFGINISNEVYRPIFYKLDDVFFLFHFSYDMLWLMLYNSKRKKLYCRNNSAASWMVLLADWL